MEQKVLLVAVNSKYIHTNPAVYSLQAYAAKKGKSIDIVEYTINEYTDDILADIYNRKPAILMFSCYIWNITVIECVVKNIKKLLPDTKIYLGGPEVSYDAEEVLNRLPEIEGIMLGEGEEILVEILEENHQDNNRQNNSKRSQFVCERLLDMEEIPFPYGENLPKDKILYYESSRGCPFSCCYCLSSVDKGVRFKSLEKVFAELEIFIKNKVNQVKFTDRTFNCNEERTLAIWQFLIEHDNGITNFHFEIAGDLLTEREIELINTMRSGLIQLEVGVQSVNVETLEIVARHTDFCKLKKAVGRIIEAGRIHIHLDLIAGLPKEDYSSFQNSFNVVYEMHPNQLQLGFLKMLKGSPIRDIADKYGIIYRAEPPYEVLATNDISYSELLELKRVEEVLEIYYNSGQFLHSIRFLEHFVKTPFELYEKIADIYFAGNGISRKQSRMFRAELLLACAVKLLSEDKLDTFKEILTFDMYLREKMKTRPAFSMTPALGKREQEKYLPEKVMLAHAEYMTIDAIQSALIGNRVERKSVTVFDYNKRDIDGNAEYHVIQECGELC